MKHVLVQERLIWEALHQDATSEFDALWEVLQSCEVQGYVTEQDLSTLYQRLAKEQGVGPASQLVTQFRRVLKVYSANADAALDAAIAHPDETGLPGPAADLPVLSVASFLERYVLYQLYQADEPGMPQGGWYRRWRASGFDPMLLWPVALVLVLQELPQFQQMLLSSGLDARDGNALDMRTEDELAIAVAPTTNPQTLSPSHIHHPVLETTEPGQAAESGEGMGRSPRAAKLTAESQLNAGLDTLTDAPLIVQDGITIPPPDVNTYDPTGSPVAVHASGSLPASPPSPPSPPSHPLSTAQIPTPSPASRAAAIPLLTQPRSSSELFSAAAADYDTARAGMASAWNNAVTITTRDTVIESEVSGTPQGETPDPPPGTPSIQDPTASPEETAVPPETPTTPPPDSGDRPPAEPQPSPPEAGSPQNDAPEDSLLGSPAFVIHPDPTQAPPDASSRDDGLFNPGTQPGSGTPPLSFAPQPPFPPNLIDPDPLPIKSWQAVLVLSGEGGDRPRQQTLLQGQSLPPEPSRWVTQSTGLVLGFQFSGESIIDSK